MRKLVLALTGLLAGGVLTGAALAMPSSSASREAAPAAAPAHRTLTIQHVYRGCHTFSNGKTRSPLMRLTLAPGGRLTIINADVDAHQLVERSGPAKLRLGGPMMMSHSRTVVFTRNGVYRLRTRTVDMPGMMEVETRGPDNILRVVVTVG
jgi:hypothetical protein